MYSYIFSWDRILSLLIWTGDSFLFFWKFLESCFCTRGSSVYYFWGVSSSTVHSSFSYFWAFCCNSSHISPILFSILQQMILYSSVISPSLHFYSTSFSHASSYSGGGSCPPPHSLGAGPNGADYCAVYRYPWVSVF